MNNILLFQSANLVLGSIYRLENLNFFDRMISKMMRLLCEDYMWVGIIVLIPAIVIFVWNLLSDNDDGKGGSLGFYGIIMPILVAVGCVVKAITHNGYWEEVTVEGESTWFLFLLGITAIQQIVALIRNYKHKKAGLGSFKTLWLVFPFFLSLYFGLTIAINWTIGVVIVLIVIEGIFSFFNGTLTNKKTLEDGTKIEGIGDTYHDKYGNEYENNHDGTFTPKER